ncbi:helix-turn-helix transcriptional regulator [Klenkia brasiliensis]|uniref:Helix-turn-helix domain-containing protein n=1 Tax=Klenkia brasiliensis TaxID=333142 RepID=A0A1G8A9V4_9ACTN|nr:helix-turn-helix transcriptional regulator [Klenkia brasiliensis]SDH17616.1 Helix-turn-helix domain-containing protein [Klenkia brasiliensis]
MEHLLVQTSDPEVADAVLREQYTVRIDSAGPGVSLRLEQDTIGGVDLASMTYGMELTASTEEPVAGTCITRLARGELCYRFGRRENRWNAGDVFVAAPAGAEFEATVHRAAGEMVVLGPAVLASVAQTVDGSPPALTGWAPVSAEAERRWLEAWRFARRTAADPDVPPLVAAATGRLLAAAVLTAFPSDASADPAATERRDARPRVVRVAVEHIRAHPERDLTVADLAAVAHVTPRALQLAFRRHLGTTPTAYLRQVRLDRAHHDLQVADPGATTVTEVARRWGFADASRFAHRYREVYGRPPSSTLDT